MRRYKKDNEEGSFISNSAALAERWRSDPMIIAVHRRGAYGARTCPASTDRLQKSAPWARIYKYTHKIHYTHFDIKFKIRNPFFYTDLFGTRAYIRTFMD
jgi:hypothetical protein